MTKIYEKSNRAPQHSGIAGIESVHSAIAGMITESPPRSALSTLTDDKDPNEVSSAVLGVVAFVLLNTFDVVVVVLELERWHRARHWAANRRQAATLCQ